MAGTFTADLTRFCKKYDADMKLVIRKISFEAFKRVVLRTPVDKGRARANWQVSQGKPLVGFEIQTEDKSGTATLTKINAETMIWECQGSLFLSNNAQHAPILEYGGYPNPPKRGSYVKGLGKGKTVRYQFLSVGGFSHQAPNGMVRVTLAEMKAWIEGNAKR